MHSAPAAAQLRPAGGRRGPSLVSRSSAQFTAFFTSAPILASAAAVNFFSAK